MSGPETRDSGPDTEGGDDEPSLPGVCVVTHPLSSAGENATRTLLEILSAITSVSLVTADLPSGSTIRENREVIELTNAGTGSSIPVAVFRFVLNQLRMCRAIRQRDEEVVLFFGATSYLLPILFSRAIGKTVVLEPRGDVPLTLRLQWERRIPGPIARLLAGGIRSLEHAGYRSSNAIVTYTPSMATELGLDRYEKKLYPNGARYVDAETFSVQTPFEDRPRRVGFLGRLDEEKGVRTLASVASELPDDITFRFVGDGDLRGELERELKDERERGAVEFTGWVDHDEVPAQLNDLRLLVLPSRPTEGLPTVILESLACGTPVYATPVSGIPDVVQEGETGCLMTETDPRQIAARIEAIVRDDDLQERSSAGLELIKTTYSFDAAVDRYREVLTAI